MEPEQIQDWLVPVAGLATGLLVVVATYLYRFNVERQRHETLRHLIEKGVEIPPELLKAGRSALRGGLVLIGLGIGMALFFGIWHRPFWGIGFIFLFMGLGLVSWHALEHRRSP
jgi:hypothetical protein